MNSLRVSTGARLHFGLILTASGRAHHYGGVGLMVRSPGWDVEVSRSVDTDRFDAEPSTQQRLSRLLRNLRSCDPVIPPLQIRIRRVLPAHTGLGSGTQLSIAITCAAVALTHPGSTPAAEQIVGMSGRSERSAIGSAGFFEGGFLVDRGTASISPRVESMQVPIAWRFLLLRPVAHQGMSGVEETQWFDKRPEMPVATAEKLATLATQRLPETLQREDFVGWASAIEEYGDLAGGFYAAVQEHIISHPAMRTVARQLRDAGVRGIAQSSWGPGICIPASDDDHAAWIAARIPAVVDGHSLEFQLTSALNAGATISYPADDITPGGTLC